MQDRHSPQTRKSLLATHGRTIHWVNRVGPNQAGAPSMSASLIGRSRESAFRLSAGTVSMSPAGSRFPADSAPRPLDGACGDSQGDAVFASAGSWFDLAS